MEYKFKCLIDGSEFEELEHLHLYLRKLKIKQADYYEKYLPRTDMGTGEIIKYKDYEQYFSTDFLNINSLKRYIKQNPEKGKEWAINWLKKRKESKNLIYAPTQVELRSLMCPTMHYYERIGGYSNICKSLGYKIKFSDSELKYNKLDKDTVIITDTREQKALSIDGYKTKIECVKYGDYALEGKYDKKIYVERKSINDFAGSFSKDLGRLKREIKRAKDDGGYLVVLVENDLNTALSFQCLPQMKFSKVTPSHVFKNIRDILHEFDNIQFLFVDGRKESSRAVIKIFELGESVKNLDLEFLYESGSLKLGEYNV